VSEKFEAGRNFSNKLWNATRFVLMNLDGFQGSPLSALDLSSAPLEDKWLASRLASVTRDATRAIDEYRFAELSRILYAFAWDDFCSAYLELCKARLADPAQQDRARSMLLLGLDTILRLLHPIMPFVTEEIWQHLHEAAGSRRMPWDDGGKPLPQSLMTAGWPEPPASWIDPETESRFGTFLGVVGAIREIRARQNVPPKTRVKVAIRTGPAQAALLEPLHAAVASMAVCDLTGVGPNVTAGPLAATATVAGCDVFVDLADLVDVGAEIARLTKENEKTEGFIEAKRRKLSDEKFTARAPAAVIAKEREQLAELESRLEKGRATLAELRSRQ
jgi:valyl-tRNA synthetase